MKKVLLLLAGLVSAGAFAGCNTCYSDQSCDTCNDNKGTNVYEADPKPCCSRYVKVKGKPIRHVNTRVSWSCPSNCQVDNDQVG